MADVMDDAQEYNELYQKVAFENQRAKNKPEFDERFNGKDCVECGEPVEPARLALYKVRCFACQSEKEQRERMYAR
jgi:RNA polymerase-binding transcription factor DksA